MTWTKRDPKKIWTFLSGLLAFSGLIYMTTAFLVAAIVQRDLELIGYDWARHIDAQTKRMVAPAIFGNEIRRDMLPESKTFQDMAEDLMIVGHVHQVDMINGDCLCEMSLVRDGVGRDAPLVLLDAGKALSPAHNHEAPDFDGHDDGEYLALQSEASGYWAAVWPRRLELLKKTKRRPAGFVPLDRDEAELILHSGQSIILHNRLVSPVAEPGAQGTHPDRVAELYYPVHAAGEVLFMMRLVIDLDPLIASSRQTVYLAITVVFSLLFLCLSLPVRALLRANQREKAAKAKLLFRLAHDKLTGTLSRAGFADKGAEVLADLMRSGRKALLLSADLDDFKEVNEAYGHEVGDEMLRAAADHLRRTLGPEATVSRLDGDEFAVLLPGDQDSPPALPQDLMAPVRLQLPDDGRTVEKTMSFGVARFPTDAMDLAGLLRAADIAARSAKSGLNGQLHRFSPALRRSVDKRIELISQFRDDATLDQLRAAYQPIIDLESSEVVAWEALLRWDHPQRGLLAAATFQDVFQDQHIARRISKAMLERIVLDTEAWSAEGYAVPPIGINVEQVDLAGSDFVWSVDALMDSGRLPGDLLLVEVTQRNLRGPNRDQILSRIEALRLRGCRILLDGFGRDGACITQLRDVSWDLVKVDREFVGSAELSKGNYAIVRAVVEMGEEFGFQVLASGIETEAQKRRLHDLGIVGGQGFFFASPVLGAAVPKVAAKFRTPATAEASAG